jgi:hypothetical protein
MPHGAYQILINDVRDLLKILGRELFYLNNIELVPY